MILTNYSTARYIKGKVDRIDYQQLQKFTCQSLCEGNFDICKLEAKTRYKYVWCVIRKETCRHRRCKKVTGLVKPEHF